MEHNTDIARRVFAFWQNATGHKRGRLDAKRMTLICSRLSDGYTEEDLKMAVFGCANSRWHQGENERREVYDSVELIFRNADKVDKFIRLGEQETSRRERAAQSEREDAERRIAQSVPGEKTREAMGKLLSIVRKEKAA